MNMLEFVELINYLESIGLNREPVDCKKYDYTGIQYKGTNVFSVTIDDTLISENVDKIILYTKEGAVNLLCVTPHLVKYKYNLQEISEVIVEQ